MCCRFTCLSVTFYLTSDMRGFWFIVIMLCVNLMLLTWSVSHSIRRLNKLMLEHLDFLINHAPEGYMQSYAHMMKDLESSITQIHAHRTIIHDIVGITAASLLSYTLLQCFSSTSFYWIIVSCDVVSIIHLIWGIFKKFNIVKGLKQQLKQLESVLTTDETIKIIGRLQRQTQNPHSEVITSDQTPLL